VGDDRELDAVDKIGAGGQRERENGKTVGQRLGMTGWHLVGR